MSTRLRMATVSLASCLGCHMSLLDVDERLLTLLERVELDRCPLTDVKQCGPCDIGFIEGVAASHPDIARQGIALCRYGQEVIRLTAGKRIHGTGAIPDGVNRNLCGAERVALAAEIDRIVRWSRDAVSIVRDLHDANRALYHGFGRVPASTMSLVAADSSLDLYDGALRGRDASGRILFDHFRATHYDRLITEAVKPWRYMKFPHWSAHAAENGWYRVGPLARVQNCDRIGTPLAEAARREWLAGAGDSMVHGALGSHWARMIEMLFAAETIAELLADDDLEGRNLLAVGERQREGVGVIETPRGTRSRAQPLRRAPDHRRSAQPDRSRDTRLRPLPVVRHPRAGQHAAASRRTGRRRQRSRPSGARLSAAQIAPTLVLPWGNPGRGDDALGPLFADAIDALALRGVECLCDFQLQIEHTVDLRGRKRVLFVDAARDGAMADTAPFSVTPLAAARDASFTSHSMSLAMLLQIYRDTEAATPPASWLLAIRGHTWALGAPHSGVGRAGPLPQPVAFDLRAQPDTRQPEFGRAAADVAAVAAQRVADGLGLQRLDATAQAAAGHRCRGRGARQRRCLLRRQRRIAVVQRDHALDFVL
jgi:hydrogenase maturation protease